MGEIIEMTTLLLIPGFIVLDLFYRARRFKTTKWWRLRAAVVTVLTFLLATEVAMFWAKVFGENTLFDLSGLGVIAGALVGILVYEFVHYWYHRAVHRYDFLWRNIHQMHHSAESLDAFGAYYLHPLDTVMFTTWSSLVLFPLLGIAPMAGVLCAFFLTFNAMFQHANIRTPHWLGYIIQRPESHGVHHARRVHQHNFSDLPIWDMAFGTFVNPRNWETDCGFYEGASARIPEMLIGRDVTKPRPQQKEREAALNPS